MIWGKYFIKVLCEVQQSLTGSYIEEASYDIEYAQSTDCNCIYLNDLKLGRCTGLKYALESCSVQLEQRREAGNCRNQNINAIAGKYWLAFGCDRGCLLPALLHVKLSKY